MKQIVIMIFILSVWTLFAAEKQKTAEEKNTKQTAQSETEKKNTPEQDENTADDIEKELENVEEGSSAESEKKKKEAGADTAEKEKKKKTAKKTEGKAAPQSDTPEQKQPADKKQPAKKKPVDSTPKTVEQTPEKIPAEKETPVITQQTEKKPAPEKKKKKKFGIHTKHAVFIPYGFLELYGWASDAKMVGNDLFIFVNDMDKSTTGMSARTTRLGMNIDFPSITVMDVSAKIELDLVGGFADSGFAETRPVPRLRHGVFTIAKTFTSGTKIKGTFGQTWATATPLVFPAFINPGAGWGHGNIWQRLPLAEFGVFQKLGSMTLGLRVAAARAMSGASANRDTFIEMNIDSGDASHMPNFQGLLSLKGELGPIAFYLATGGAYGVEDYSGGVNINGAVDASGEKVMTYGDKVDVWLYNVGGIIKHKYVQVSGKYYIGRNIDVFGTFGGGLTYDENGDVDGSLQTTGYWVQLSLTPFDALALHTGVGSEDPDNEFARYTENKSFWFSAYYTTPIKPLRIGFQWTQLQTFVPRRDGTDAVDELLANSFMGSVRLSF